MEGGRIHPSCSQCHYGVVPPRTTDMAAKYSANSTSKPQLADGILGDSHQMLPASKSRVMNTAEAIQVGAFHLGKGRFDLLIGERNLHLQLLVFLIGGGDRNGGCELFV